MLSRKARKGEAMEGFAAPATRYAEVLSVWPETSILTHGGTGNITKLAT